MNEGAKSANLVQDFIPVLHYLRYLYRQWSDSGSDRMESDICPEENCGVEQDEVEYILHQLQLPSCELENLLADAGYCFDDLELVKFIRNSTRSAILTHTPTPCSQSTSSSGDSSSLTSPEGASAVAGGSSGHPCHHPRLVETIRKETSASITASTTALSSLDLLCTTNPLSSQAHKNKKRELYLLI